MCMFMTGLRLTIGQAELGHLAVTDTVCRNLRKEDEVYGSHSDCGRPVLLGEINRQSDVQYRSPDHLHSLPRHPSGIRFPMPRMPVSGGCKNG
jgi:hypothetical protein